jgi:GT2 family glycosyltransferase
MTYETLKTVLSDELIDQASFNPVVAVVILNWNSWNDTVNCLDSLVNHDFNNLHIVVVDNASCDGSLSHIKQYVEDLFVSLEVNNLDLTDNPFFDCNVIVNGNLGERRITLLSMDNNFGFSGGCNRGVEFLIRAGVKSDYIFFLNNDCLLFSGCIRNLVKSACNNNGVAAALQYMNQSMLPSIHISRWPLLSFIASPILGKPVTKVGEEMEIEVDWVSGAALLISTNMCRQIIAETGYVWRESYFLYSEDFELSYRLKSNHVRLIVSTLAKVEHCVGSSGSGLLSIYYMRRNRSHICRDHCRTIFIAPCLS